MTRFRLPTTALLVSVLVVACGGSDPSTDGGVEGPSPVSGDVAWADQCTTEAPVDLPTDFYICVDSGFRPESSGFSFENWAGPVAEDAVTVSTAVAMFGEEATCARLEGDVCVPYPAVDQWIEEMNLSLEGGRCEGMAVLSQRINDGWLTPDQLQAGAFATVDLERPTIPVSGSISRWWVTQTLDSVANWNADTRELSPSQIASNVAAALRDGEGVTLGLYSDGGGHAITPIAVTWDGDRTVEILNYDNNYPGEITRVVIDTDTETWTYDDAALNADMSAEPWSGTTGSMDYTIMSVREGLQPAPWGSDDGSSVKGAARVSVSTGGRSIAGLVVTVGDTVVDSRDLDSAAEGVRIFPSRGGGFGTGAVVLIPAGLTGVTVRPVIGEVLDPTAEPIKLVVALDAPGAGSLIVRDEVEAADAAAYDDFELDLSTDGDFESDVDVSDDGDVEAGYAYDEESLEADLEDGQDLDITDPDGEGDIDIALTDEEGNELYDVSFDGDAEGEELTEFDIDVDEATGEVDVSEVEIEGVELDGEFIDLSESESDAPAEEAPETDAPVEESPDTEAPVEESPDTTPSETDPPPAEEQP